jgi:hypothetical protein
MAAASTRTAVVIIMTRNDDVDGHPKERLLRMKVAHEHRIDIGCYEPPVTTSIWLRSRECPTSSPSFRDPPDRSLRAASNKVGRLIRTFASSPLMEVESELWLNLGDGVNQAADFFSDATSIPSLNVTPLTTFGN